MIKQVVRETSDSKKQIIKLEVPAVKWKSAKWYI